MLGSSPSSWVTDTVRRDSCVVLLRLARDSGSGVGVDVGVSTTVALRDIGGFFGTAIDDKIPFLARVVRPFVDIEPR